jgi:hypothetical protein
LTFLPRLHTLNAIAEKQSFGKTSSAKANERHAAPSACTLRQAQNPTF